MFAGAPVKEKKVVFEYRCDVCKKRKTKHLIRACAICGQHLCTYCRYELSESYRTRDDGYSLTKRSVAFICKKHHTVVDEQ